MDNTISIKLKQSINKHWLMYHMNTLTKIHSILDNTKMKRLIFKISVHINPYRYRYIQLLEHSNIPRTLLTLNARVFNLLKSTVSLKLLKFDKFKFNGLQE